MPKADANDRFLLLVYPPDIVRELDYPRCIGKGVVFWEVSQIYHAWVDLLLPVSRIASKSSGLGYTGLSTTFHLVN